MLTPEKVRERVRSALYTYGVMTPETKRDIIKSAENTGKVIDYTERVTVRDIHGNVLKDISASQGNTTTASPNTAETNTPGHHALPNKQKVHINKNGVLKPVVLFTENKPITVIQPQIILTTDDIRKAKKLAQIDKENLTFDPRNIGVMPAIPIKNRKKNKKQNDVMGGLPAAKLMAISLIEERLENGLAEKAGLVKKRIDEYSDDELKVLCFTADIRIIGQWLHSFAYSLADGTPEGDPQVPHNLSACDAAVNDRMKTAEEIARDKRANEELKELQYAAEVKLKRKRVASSVFTGSHVQEGEEYKQTLSYRSTSVTFFHSSKNKNKRTKADRAYLEPLADAYLSVPSVDTTVPNPSEKKKKL